MNAAQDGAQGPSFSLTTWFQALLLLEAAHVLVQTCTSQVLRDNMCMNYSQVSVKLVLKTVQ